MKKMLIKLSLWVLKKCKSNVPIDINTIITFRLQKFYVRQVKWSRSLNGIDSLVIEAEEVPWDEICYAKANNDTI